MEEEDTSCRKKRRRSVRNLRRRSEICVQNFTLLDNPDCENNEQNLEYQLPVTTPDVYGSIWKDSPDEPVVKKRRRKSNLFVNLPQQKLSTYKEQSVHNLSVENENSVVNRLSTENISTNSLVEERNNESAETGVSTKTATLKLSVHCVKESYDSNKNTETNGIAQNIDDTASCEQYEKITSENLITSDSSPIHTAYKQLVVEGGHDGSFCNTSAAAETPFGEKIIRKINNSLQSDNSTSPAVENTSKVSPSSMSPDFPMSPSSLQLNNSLEGSYIVPYSHPSIPESQPVKDFQTGEGTVTENSSLKSGINFHDSEKVTNLSLSDKENSLTEGNGNLNTTPVDKENNFDKVSPGFFGMCKAFAGKVVNFVKTSPSFLTAPAVGSDIDPVSVLSPRKEIYTNNTAESELITDTVCTDAKLQDSELGTSVLEKTYYTDKCYEANEREIMRSDFRPNQCKSILQTVDEENMRLSQLSAVGSAKKRRDRKTFLETFEAVSYELTKDETKSFPLSSVGENNGINPEKEMPATDGRGVEKKEEADARSSHGISLATGKSDLQRLEKKTKSKVCQTRRKSDRLNTNSETDGDMDDDKTEENKNTREKKKTKEKKKVEPHSERQVDEKRTGRRHIHEIGVVRMEIEDSYNNQELPDNCEINKMHKGGRLNKLEEKESMTVTEKRNFDMFTTENNAQLRKKSELDKKRINTFTRGKCKPKSKASTSGSSKCVGVTEQHTPENKIDERANKINDDIFDEATIMSEDIANSAFLNATIIDEMDSNSAVADGDYRSSDETLHVFSDELDKTSASKHVKNKLEERDLKTVGTHVEENVAEAKVDKPKRRKRRSLCIASSEENDSILDESSMQNKVYSDVTTETNAMDKVQCEIHESSDKDLLGCIDDDYRLEKQEAAGSMESNSTEKCSTKVKKSRRRSFGVVCINTEGSRSSQVTEESNSALIYKEGMAEMPVSSDNEHTDEIDGKKILLEESHIVQEVEKLKIGCKSVCDSSLIEKTQISEGLSHTESNTSFRKEGKTIVHKEITADPLDTDSELDSENVNSKRGRKYRRKSANMNDVLKRNFKIKPAEVIEEEEQDNNNESIVRKSTELPEDMQEAQTVTEIIHEVARVQIEDENSSTPAPCTSNVGENVQNQELREIREIESEDPMNMMKDKNSILSENELTVETLELPEDRPLRKYRKRRSAEIYIRREDDAVPDQPLLDQALTASNDERSNLAVEEKIDVMEEDNFGRRKARRKSAGAAELQIMHMLSSDTDAGCSETKKGKKRKLKEESQEEIEQIYKNKNFVKPEEKKAWLTVLESPSGSGDVFGKKRLYRHIDFEKPAQMKLRRRLQRAVKNGWDPRKRKRQELKDDYVQTKLANLWSELNEDDDEDSLENKLRSIIETT